MIRACAIALLLAGCLHEPQALRLPSPGAYFVVLRAVDEPADVLVEAAQQ